MKKSFLIPIFVILLLFFFLFSFSNLKRGNNEETKKQLEKTIKQSVVTCYAMEGIYPPDLDYIKEHYGVRFDEKHYIVIYDAYGENMMPDITILEKNYDE